MSVLSLKSLYTSENFNSEITSVHYSSCGKYIALGSLDGTVKVWEILSGKIAHEFKSNYPVTSMCYSPCGKYIASGSGSGLNNGTIQIWEISNETLVHEFEWTVPILSVCYSPCGKYVALGSPCRKYPSLGAGIAMGIEMWKISNETLVRELEGHTDSVESVHYSPCGKYVASGSKDATIRIWNTSTGEIVYLLRGHKEYKGGDKKTHSIQSLCYSSDGKYIVSGGYDKTVILWNASTGKIVRILKEGSGKEAHSSGIKSVCYSPCGKYVISGHENGIINLWEASTGKTIYAIKEHKSAVLSLSFCLCGGYVASGSADGTVKIWKIPSIHELIQILSREDNPQATTQEALDSWVDQKALDSWDDKQKL